MKKNLLTCFGRCGISKVHEQNKTKLEQSNAFYSKKFKTEEVHVEGEREIRAKEAAEQSDLKKEGKPAAGRATTTAVFGEKAESCTQSLGEESPTANSAIAESSQDHESPKKMQDNLEEFQETDGGPEPMKDLQGHCPQSDGEAEEERGWYEMVSKQGQEGWHPQDVRLSLAMDKVEEENAGEGVSDMGEDEASPEVKAPGGPGGEGFSEEGKQRPAPVEEDGEDGFIELKRRGSTYSFENLSEIQDIPSRFVQREGISEGKCSQDEMLLLENRIAHHLQESTQKQHEGVSLSLKKHDCMGIGAGTGGVDAIQDVDEESVQLDGRVIKDEADKNVVPSQQENSGASVQEQVIEKHREENGAHGWMHSQTGRSCPRMPSQVEGEGCVQLEVNNGAHPIAKNSVSILRARQQCASRREEESGNAQGNGSIDHNSPLFSECKRAVDELLQEEEEEPQVRAAAAIRMLAKEDPEARVTIAMMGAIPKLVTMLDHCNPATRFSSLLALLNLAIGNNHNKEQIVLADAIPKMVTLLGEEDNSVPVQEACVAALFSLSALDSNKLMIGASGAMSPLARILQNGTDQGKKDALRALYNLSIAQANVPALVDAGAVELLVKTLHDPARADKALAMLGNLVTADAGRRRLAATTASLPLLVDILRWADEPKSQERAAYVLMVLAHYSHSQRRAMAAAAAVPALTAVALLGSTLAQKRAARLLECLRGKVRPVSAPVSARMMPPGDEGAPAADCRKFDKSGRWVQQSRLERRLDKVAHRRANGPAKSFARAESMKHLAGASGFGSGAAGGADVDSGSS